MQLTINNLGPIKGGTINLNKRLTIITGPNNTGKSYLTYLIHGISQYEKLNSLTVTLARLRKIFAETPSIREDVEHSRPISITNALKETSSAISDMVVDIVKNNFVKIFASSTINPQIFLALDDISSFAKSYFPDEILVSDGIIYEVSENGERKKFEFSSLEGSEFPTPFEKVIHILALTTSVCIDYQLGARSHFFPAERTAINLFAKHITAVKAEIKDELDSEVIAGMSDDELGRRLRAQVKSAPKYPYAIRDYINFVNGFERVDEESKLALIATNIESTLASGKVHLNDFNQVIFTPNNSTTLLELHLSSSLVKSLSYLILYLRYAVIPGSQVIIDEPELNLHPNLQVAIAKIIAEMVNAGLKVIISTHSDYLIKELNNLMLLGKMPDSEHTTAFLTQHNYSQQHLLDAGQVGAYFLDDHTIKPIDIEKDGLAVPSINDAIIAIDSIAEEIFLKLEA